MKLIYKAFLFLRKEGLIETIKKVIVRSFEIAKHIPYIINEKITCNKKLSVIKELARGKDVYILIPCIDWNIPLYQRPHQIANELSNLDNSLVLFISDQYKYDNFSCYHKINNNLYLFSHRVISYLDNVLVNSNKKIVFNSWMRQSHLLNKFSFDKLIYEYIDELTLFYYHTPELEKIHFDLMSKADLTVCTAKVLYDKALPYAKKTLLSENAGDYNFFHNNRNCEINKLLKDKLEGYSSIIGYYGCLADWFDYDLIITVAKEKKDWLFILVGYDFDGSLVKIIDSKLKNIIHIPAQPYKELPSFISAFDIQCIPFIINDITLSTSPVKLFEYMASEKPILTSRLPECLKYESVLTYESSNDFIEKAESLMKNKDNKQYLSKLHSDAINNTWSMRVQQILNNI